MRPAAATAAASKAIQPDEITISAAVTVPDLSNVRSHITAAPLVVSVSKIFATSRMSLVIRIRGML